MKPILFTGLLSLYVYVYRMRKPMNVLYCMNRHMGINVCGEYLAILQLFLDKTDVCGVFKHQYRHRVTGKAP
jgi:hypothetical protein